MTVRVSKENVPVWEDWPELRTFPFLHGVTERVGGCSSGEYASLNCDFEGGDTAFSVLENRRRLCAALACDPLNITTTGNGEPGHIVVVGEAERGAGAGDYFCALKRTKALMTDLRDTPLFMFAADAVPLILFDAQHHACAVVTADIPELKSRLVSSVLFAMNIIYGSRPEELFAYIGPAASEEYVTVNVADALIKKQGEIGLTVHVNMKEAVERELKQGGVDSQHIFVSNSCTYKERERFFSLRRQGIYCGRNTVFALLL